MEVHVDGYSLKVDQSKLVRIATLMAPGTGMAGANPSALEEFVTELMEQGDFFITNVCYEGYGDNKTEK